MEQSPETPAAPEPVLSGAREARPAEAAPKPSAAERRAAIETGQKTKRRKGFIMGLFVGQLLIVGIDLGFSFLVPIIEKRYQFNSPIPIQSLVFIGMTAGIAMTGLLIFFILGLQGAGYVLGKKKVDVEVMARVRRTAIDTARGRTMDLCEYIRDFGAGGATVAALAARMSEDDVKIRGRLAFLRRIGVVETRKKTDDNDQEIAGRSTWFLTRRLERLWEEVFGAQADDN